MEERVQTLLQDDVEQIREALGSFTSYRFEQDLCQRMEAGGLSSVALAARCFVSHTIVDRWRTGKARPNGKERMKELGMALGMEARELDEFLFRNGYPKLYAKNPLDSAASLLLLHSAGWPDVVHLYRELVERLDLTACGVHPDAPPLATTVMREDLQQAALRGQVSTWFRNHRGDFGGDGKVQLSDLRLIRFILLYIGDSSINELFVAGELPLTIRNLLYPMVGGRAVNVRGLREKLIAFGLYLNLTEEELDALLLYARLRPLSQAETQLDLAVLCSVRMAHERYPLYERENLCRVIQRLKASGEEFEQGLLPQYLEREQVNAAMTAYYERSPRSGEEQLYEECFTSYGDRGVMDYTRCVLLLLMECGALTQNEIQPLLELTERTQEGKSLWN